MLFHFIERQETSEHPAGWTVTKGLELPEGDLGITEYQWGEASLWFVDADEFTADERQEAYEKWQAL